MLSDALLRSFFLRAKHAVESAGYREEYQWQRSVLGRSWSETDFLREYCWVVFCCGFREQTVRKWFSYLSMAFFDFKSARQIAANREDCKTLALAAINNRAKVDAIIHVAVMIDALGFMEVSIESIGQGVGPDSEPAIYWEDHAEPPAQESRH